MTSLPFCNVLRMPTVAKAVRFDGTPEMGAQIVDWLVSKGMQKGHFRADLGRAQGSIFMPRYAVGDVVLRADPGDWIVLDQRATLTILGPDEFAQLYEVAL